MSENLLVENQRLRVVAANLGNLNRELIQDNEMFVAKIAGLGNEVIELTQKTAALEAENQKLQSLERLDRLQEENERLREKAKKYDRIAEAVGDTENAMILSGAKHRELVDRAQKLEAIREHAPLLINIIDFSIGDGYSGEHYDDLMKLKKTLEVLGE